MYIHIKLRLDLMSALFMFMFVLLWLHILLPEAT